MDNNTILDALFEANRAITYFIISIFLLWVMVSITNNPSIEDLIELFAERVSDRVADIL